MVQVYASCMHHMMCNGDLPQQAKPSIDHR